MLQVKLFFFNTKYVQIEDICIKNLHPDKSTGYTMIILR